MTRPSPALLAAFLVALAAALAAVTLAKGGFYFSKHEGDMLHLLEIVFREARGEWPHLDFQTPIGVLATAPIALFVWLGVGIGHALLYAQVLVTAVALPAIWWASATRFRGALAYVFGGLVVVLILALVFGGPLPDTSMSMHYNRWSWAATFVALALAVLPPDEDLRSPVVDGIIIGAALSAMALTKMTFFAAFLLPIAVALIGRGALRTIVAGIATGFFVVAGLTLAAGPRFWSAYVGDLLSVVKSAVRGKASDSLVEIMNTPENLGGSIVLLASVILLRQAGRRLEGIVLLLLVPAFLYVTYQNWGNDAKWTWFLGLVLLTLRPAHGIRGDFGFDARQPLVIAAVVSFGFAAPSVINLAYSPFRHLSTDTTSYVPLLPGSGHHTDLALPKIRAMRIDAAVALDTPGEPFDAGYDPGLRKYSSTYEGESFPDCQIELGYVAWYEALSRDLADSGLVEGKTLFAADILSSFWLYGAGEPLPGGTPWYYAGLPGWDAADYLLVPFCPISMGVRKLILDEVEATGVTLTEVRRNDFYVLYAK